MKVGDMVRIRDIGFSTKYWPESIGQMGMIVANAKRLYIPAVKVMVLGEIAEFDLEEIEVVDGNR
jgi:hypothetical protein